MRFPRLIILFCIATYFSCSKDNSNSVVDPDTNLIAEISCDAENLTQDKKLFMSTNTGYNFRISGVLSTDKYRSGKQSIKLNKETPYGFAIEISNIQADHYFEVSAWKFGSKKGVLVVSDKKAEKFYLTSEETSSSDSSGWHLVKLDFYIPACLDFEFIRIYAYNPDTVDCYFDDITIRHFSMKQYPEYDGCPINILLDSISMNKLKEKRIIAFKAGMLETADDDYVKTKLVYGRDTLSARTRLKGDWLDHLKGEKWSFRMKIRKNKSWNRMITFSLQTPETRYYLDEWVAHQLFKQEDVLAPKYGFVPVQINGKSLGLYAYEEHFAKHLLGSYNRREGPILKFNEDAFWTKINYQLNNDTNLNIPDFKASFIEPFQENHTRKNRDLFSQFKIAQNLLYDYKYDHVPLSLIFDTDKTARYFALMDIVRGYHAIRWHNQRFYYNPVTSKIELIAYDCYTSNGEYIWLDECCLADYIISHAKYKEDIDLYLNFFKDEKIVDLYLKYLDLYSQKEFLDQFFSENRANIDSLEKSLSKEFKNYVYNRSFIPRNAKNIRKFLSDKSLSELKKEIVNKANKLEIKSSLKEKTNIKDRKILSNYVQFYRSGSDIIGVNYLSDNYKIVGYSSNDSLILWKERNNKNIPGFSETPVNIIMNAREDMKFVFIKMPGSTNKIPLDIKPWDFPHAKEIYSDPKTINLISGVEELSDNSIFISSNLTINKPLIIPENRRFIIKEGVEIDLVREAYILSYSPVIFTGTAKQKIYIRSSDGTGGGITVLEAGSKSRLEHVVIDQQVNFHESNWSLTGSVNFYQSDIIIRNSIISNNRSEDALNIIRSDFEITHCTFDNIFADAFDSDFSNGNIRNVDFRDVGNDAIDISGGHVMVEFVTIMNAGDKGVSGGEASTIEIRNSEISNTNLAVASKDLSYIQIDGLKINNSNYGIVTYCKKGEYGPAILTGKNISINITNRKYLFETGSTIYLEGIESIEYKENLAELFYPGK